MLLIFKTLVVIYEQNKAKGDAYLVDLVLNKTKFEIKYKILIYNAGKVPKILNFYKNKTF